MTMVLLLILILMLTSHKPLTYTVHSNLNLMIYLISRL